MIRQSGEGDKVQPDRMAIPDEKAQTASRGRKARAASPDRPASCRRLTR